MSAAQSDNERPHIRVKGSDGEWHEIETKRRETGDPELDRLWRMSFGELEAILDDPERPLHEKAGQVAREITEPLAEMAKEVLKPLVDSLPKFDVSALMPKVDFAAMMPKLDLSPILAAYDQSSWLSKIAGNFPKIEVPTSMLDSIRAIEPIMPPTQQAEMLPFIDYDSVEPPDFTVDTIAHLTEVRVAELRETMVEYFPTMVGHLGELVAEAKASRESGQRALKWASISGWSAIAAAAAALIGIVVTALAP